MRYQLIIGACLTAFMLSFSPCHAQDPDPEPASQPASKPAEEEDPLASLPKELTKLKELYAEETAKLDTEYDQENPPPAKGGTFEQAELILMKIASSGKRREAFELVQILKKRLKHPEIQLEAWQAQRRAIGAIEEDTEAWTFVLNKIKRKSSDWKQKVDIIYAMRDHEGEGPDDALIKAMRDRNDYVSGAAMRTLAYRKVVRAVPAIIKILAKSESKVNRTYLDARQCLTAITGFDIASSSGWRKKWKEVGKDFDPENGRGKAKLYFPVDAIASDRVVMLLDTSSSMKYRDRETGISKDVDPRTTTRELPVERERLFRGKRRMQDMLLTLRKKAKFNICHFNQTAHSWQTDGFLIRVDDGAIDTALDYLENYKPRGLSNALAGFELVFKSKDVDTIYYMSDGVASNKKGNRVEYLTLLAQVRNMNRHRAVRIFSVSFKGADRGFMTKLAQQNGGGYQEIR